MYSTAAASLIATHGRQAVLDVRGSCALLLLFIGLYEKLFDTVAMCRLPTEEKCIVMNP